MYRSSTRSRTSLLYHSLVSRLSKRPTQKWLVGLALLGAATLAHERLDAAGPADRLDQFRQLARSHNERGRIARRLPRDVRAARRGDRREPRHRRSLRVAPPSCRIGSTRSARRGARPRSTSCASGRLVVGAFQMSDGRAPTPCASTAGSGARRRCLTTLSREGRPTVYPWAPGAERRRAVRPAPGKVRPRDGDIGTAAPRPRPPAGRRRPRRLVHDRSVPGGTDGARVSRARRRDPRPLRAATIRAGRPDARDRPSRGRVPRRRRRRGTLVRASPSGSSTAGTASCTRRCAELFAALAAGTRRSLAKLVPDRAVRGGCRRRCDPTAACDAPDGGAEPRTGVGRGHRRAHAVGADLPARRRPLAPRRRGAGARVSGPPMSAPTPRHPRPLRPRGRRGSTGIRAGRSGATSARTPPPRASPSRSSMPPPNVTGSLHWGHALDHDAAGHADPHEADGRLQHALAPGHRPRRDRRPRGPRAAARRRGQDEGRPRPRRVPRARLAVEGGVRGHDHPPAATPGRLVRLVARALHDGSPGCRAPCASRSSASGKKG